MSETKTPWSPARAVLPPDPNGHNRALDRVAAEHLREVAPGLAASPAPPQPEPAKANAPRKGSKAWAIQEACRIVGIAFHGIAAEYDEASDCFCSEGPFQDYRNGGRALAFVEAAVREKLAREKAPAPPAEATNPVKTLSALLVAGGAKLVTRLTAAQACDVVREIARQNGHDVVIEAPAPEATGEMSREEVVGFLSAVQDANIDADPRWLDNGVAAVLAHDAALRTRAREAEERAERAERNYKAARDCEEKRGNEWSRHALKVTRERDEAREQRDAAQGLLSEALCNLGTARGDIAAANARAEEAERNYDRLRDISLCRLQFPDGTVPGGTEQCARGWHDWYEKENAARIKAEQALGAMTAHRMSDDALQTAASVNADLRARLAAAEAEVKRLNNVVDEHAGAAMRAGLERDRAEHRLKLANEEIVRVRLAYDDPSLDGTDGAPPAWWRGSDAGVAGAVRIVNEALDEALPLAGCVGGADLERVRQRIAALRERAERLVRAGDDLYRWVDPASQAARNWAAARGTKS